MGIPERVSVSIQADDRMAAAAARRPTALALRRFLQSRSAVIGGLVLAAIVMATLLAPVLTSYDPIKINYDAALKPPGAAHLMGTDRFGRDVFSRVLWGGRITLPVGVVAVGIAGSIGVLLGLLAGYRGARVESLIMRMMDLMLAFPGILLALAIIAVLGGSLMNLMVAVGISSIPDYVRLTRGMVLSAKEQEYVIAARAIGYRDHSILFRHILPNIAAPLVVLGTLSIARAVITAAALSFLGLGVRPPTPEWGKMLAEGQEFLQYAWWIAFFPGLAIMLTVFSVNLLGDGLRDAMDPRLRTRVLA